MFAKDTTLLGGRYRYVRPIGRGGMGEVYLAEDMRVNNRPVAVKIVRILIGSHLDPNVIQETLHLFQQEMQVIAALDHPHILQIYDFGEERDGNTLLRYMVMPYRPEGSLADWLQRPENKQKLTPNAVIHFVTQAADALQYVHDRHHIVHRDVKPSNFLVRESTDSMLPDLLLADFGLVKVNTVEETNSRSIRGTGEFMSPEQWAGQPEPATDQYALAIMAYLLLTAHTPFSGTMHKLMHDHCAVPPQPPSSFNPTIPPALDAVILRALEKQPGQRFPSIRELAQAFQQASQFSQNPGPIKIQSQTGTLVAGTTFNHTNAPISPTPKRRARLQPQVLVSLIMLVIIISITGIGATIYNSSVTSASNAAATAQAQKTATGRTATAQVITGNPYPSYLSGSGTLAFFDPLNQATGSKWSTSSANSNGGACQFTGRAYHVSTQNSTSFTRCFTSDTFSNFAFEVHLTIQGDCGGITFRDGGNGHFYYFRICQDNHYRVRKYDSTTSSTDLSNNTSIPTKLSQQNTMAVLADGDTMTFYVNNQQLERIHDTSYTAGHLGLLADQPFGDATDVAFSNARLWTW